MSKLFISILDLLNQHGIRYTVTEHEPIKSAQDAAKIRGKGVLTPDEAIRRASKSILLRSEGRFFLFVIPGDLKIDFKKARALLQTASVSLATPDEVLRVTGVPVGSVPPFGNLFLPPVPTYAEQSMLRNTEMDCSPGRNDASLTLRVEDWRKAAQPQMADFAAPTVG
jgi:Ala-tRNA(Pro) deacylase